MRRYAAIVPNSIVNADFEPPIGWRSGHLQTVRSKALPRRFDLDAVGTDRILTVALDGTGDDGGDRASILLHTSKRFQEAQHVDGDRIALVALVHGLGGSAESDYVRCTAHGLLQLGFNVARIDLRGAGLSKQHSSAFYHAGRTEDLRRILAGLAEQPEARRSRGGGAALGLVGFSLGGNQVIKLLAEPLADLPVVAGVAVSAPLDLAVGSEHLHHMMFGMYEQFILRALKRDSLEPRPSGLPRLSESELGQVVASRSIVDFDNAITAPRNGWRDADEYYRVNSSGQFLPDVSRPLLVIHSLDDPMIPAGPYQAIDWRALAPGPVSWRITDVGGHVGFHERGRTHRWFVREAAWFLAGGFPGH